MGLQRWDVMKTLLMELLAVVAVAAIAVGAFMAGRESVDKTADCGSLAWKWDERNGCELLPGYMVVYVGEP